MITHATYQVLFNIVEDIKQESRRSPAFAYLNNSRVKRFFQINAMRINLMEKKIQDIKERYLLKDETGKYKLTLDENGKPTGLLFLDAAHKASFEAEMNELFMSSIQIHD